MLDAVAMDRLGENLLQGGRPQVQGEFAQRPTDRSVVRPEARAVMRGVQSHLRREVETPQRLRAQRDPRVELDALGKARLEAGIGARHASGRRIKSEIKRRPSRLLVNSGK